MERTLRNWSASSLVALVLICQPLLNHAQIPDKEAAKAAKITPDLLAIHKSGLSINAAPASGLQKVNLFRTIGNSIAIEAVAEDGKSGQDLLRELQAVGLTKGIAYKQIIFGYLPIDKIEELKNVTSLHIARPSYKPQRNVGAVTSQGDKAMRSDIARQTYSVTGAGVKVGVMADSYNGLGGAPAGVASGDLPPNVQVIEDYSESDATDEGRAMAEIVHDIAPGADIAFYTANKGQAGFAKGIHELATAGCKIITDDIHYDNEPFFQDGIISLAIRDVVTNQGVSHFTSAGNSGRSSYESTYISGGIITDPSSGFLGRAHDFGGGDYFQTITIPAHGQAYINFQWDDRFYSVNGGTGAQTDMDLYVFNNGALRLDLSSYDNNIGNDPVEVTQILNNSDAPLSLELVLVKFLGPDPTRVKWINDNSSSLLIEHDTKSATIYGHLNEASAISVGAADYRQTPVYNSSLSTALIEGFSTAGGTPILFDEAGNPMAPVIRKKPEIVAANRANTTFFTPGFDPDGDGFPNFAGTSASAPHAAGVAALMQQKANNTLSKEIILSILERTALDMDDPLTLAFDNGFDFLTGYGFIQADKALQAVDALTATAFAITGVTTVSCATVTAGKRTLTFTPQYSGLNGQPITFQVVNETLPTTAPAPYSVNLYTDNPVITLEAMQAGTPNEARFTYNWLAACGSTPPTPPVLVPGTLVITGVTGVNCSVVAPGKRLLTFTPQYSGLNGQPITFQVVNETLPTTAPAPYSVNLYTDNPVITLEAMQAGTPNEARFTYNWLAACGSARQGVEPGAGLQVWVLGNPIEKETAEIEIRGVSGRAVKVELMDIQGQVLQQHVIEQAGTIERVDLPISGRQGILLLNIGSGTGA